MLVAPLVMPEVITGLSLLVLFISLKEAIGWPAERGFTTITIAHITFSMASETGYRTVLPASSASSFDMRLLTELRGSDVVYTR